MDWPQLIFVIAILAFALWQKGWIRLVLSVCLVIWGTFAIPYDIKIAAPLLITGGLLFFETVLTLIGEYRRCDEV